MNVEKVFVSLNAKDLAALSGWWAKLLDRSWDREPKPNCREWTVAGNVLFQVLEGMPDLSTTVAFKVSDLDAEISRLRQVGIEAPDPIRVEGFKSLRYAQFDDPEGNQVNLLDGE